MSWSSLFSSGTTGSSLGSLYRGMMGENAEQSYLRSLGQQVPSGVTIEGPSETFKADPAYTPQGGSGRSLASLGAGQSGGGGSGSTGPSPNSLNEKVGGSGLHKGEDKVGDALLAPKRAARERTLQILPEVADIGSSVGPVARSAGGAAMARAMMAERAKAQDTFAANEASRVDSNLRKTAAVGNVVKQSVGIVADLVKRYYGIGSTGDNQVGNSGGGGGGGGGMSMSSIASLAGSFSGGGGGGGMGGGGMSGMSWGGY